MTPQVEKYLGIKSINLKIMSGKKMYREPFKITKDSTSQWFQTRNNHIILATNTFLYKIKVTNDSRCTFYSLVDETIEHLFGSVNVLENF